MSERSRKNWARAGLLFFSALWSVNYFFNHDNTPMERWELVSYAFGGGIILGSAFFEKAKKQPLGQYVTLWYVMMVVDLLMQDLGWVGRWFSLVVAAVGLTLFGLSFKYTFKPL